MIDGQISSGHARALLGIEDVEQRLKTARKIVDQGMTVRQVENIARFASSRRKSVKQPQPKAFKDLADRIAKMLNARVQVKMVGKKGKIEISFPLDRLSEIVEHLLDFEKQAGVPQEE